MRPRTIVLALLVMCSKCLTIRVPTVWNSDSEVQNEQSTQETSGNLHQQQKPIPVEYFQYTAKKPQFAAEIAAFHGVPNPDSHYKAYPIRPYTGKEKPQLGHHELLNENRPVFQNFQDFTNYNGEVKEAIPVSSNYEIFHPYKAEEPGLQALYKDPVLNKIRNDIRSSQNRLQNYEKEAGKPDIAEGEYLESPEQTDRKKFPHRNVPAQFEIHRPHRRPVYYRPPPIYTHDHILNHRYRHPWNQQNAKIRPLHYRPLKNHLKNLRQNHALKYEDEHNEYPQLPPLESYSEPEDGYDIYERGKDKYIQLRNNVDESINSAIKENQPTIHQKLELQNNGDKIVTETGDKDDEEEEEEFIPIKNYAQVRKTDTVKHLPRDAAFEDAASFDEIRNAPRLREAIKSNKAQTVYTEEGYEDAAYDHAGEQKHASENEAHAGFLKEKELSSGKFKTPSVSAKYEDSNGSAYRDQSLHGEKWKNDDEDNEQEDDEEDFSEDETEKSVEAEVYDEVSGERNKRKDFPVTDKSIDTNFEHEVNKRETKFKIPEINLNSTFLNEHEILETAKIKLVPQKDNIKEKYPYYFKNLKQVHRDSPLRYSENLKLIPKKSRGGTEFYDSRSMFQCSEVDDNIDPLPDKLKKSGHPDSDEDEVNEEEENIQKKKGEANFDHLKDKPRLKGLGDKIDCFKAKYFGENPLDSPFFKEEIIANPEPLKVPKLPIFNIKQKEISAEESNHNIVLNKSEELRKESETDIFTLLDKLNSGQKNLQESLVKTNKELKESFLSPQNISYIRNTELAQQSNVYSDILENIKKKIRTPTFPTDHSKVSSQLFNPNENAESNVTYNSYQNKEDVTKHPTLIRKRRATPFVYEPYKIIRDGQVQESKKTTTTSNISPLIKQLQSSRVVDRVTKANQDIEQPVKRNVATRTYKDIGRQDRTRASRKENENSDAGFVDVNESTRKGEPKYELRPTNHKSHYIPVENKKAMSVKDYESQTNKSKETTKRPQTNSRQRTLKRQHTTAHPYFDVSQFLPKPSEAEKQSASNTFKKVIKIPETVTEPQTTDKKATKVEDNSDDEEDYEEYDDYENEEITTTTTTPKPSFRRRRTKTMTTTTIKPEEEPLEQEIEPELPKLRLITRFRTSTLSPTSPTPKRVETKLEKPKYKIDEDGVIEPKYREKKKKTSQRTLVTDTKTYGDGEDDMMKEEVDAMIGVQHDMDEYMPQYEKDIAKKNKEKELHKSSEDGEEEEDDDDDDDDTGEYNDDEDEDEDDDDEEEEEEEEEHEIEPVLTTPEPTKRTLPRTTETPISTTESRSSRLELKPIVMKKKIEIHKELPVNKSSAHVTQFKQDIKEVEIIKEVPSKPSKSPKKPTKNIEALELYKDENLAKDVNKLGGIEIFKEGLDLKNGPRHGGNYRSAKLIELNQDSAPIPESLHGGNLKVAKDDTEPSQSDTKPVELEDFLPARKLHGGNLKSQTDVSRSRNSEKSGKLELADSYDKSTSKTGMHGGNLRKDRTRGGQRIAKLTELEDESTEKDDDDYRSTHRGNSKSDSRGSNGRMHGGNYRSAKLVQAEDEDVQKPLEIMVKEKRGNSNGRSSGAVLLNSLAQAVPILTTTPGYILDPSKRMYYYVDA